MSSKHTPGPWSLQESATHVRIVGADGENIWHEDKRCPRVMDDARLIASAPEMLEALRGLDEAYCRAGDALSREERAEDRKRLMAARAAIAKATGESQ